MAGSKMILTIALISLVSVLGAGCSDDSNPVSTPVIDTAPPAVPVELSASYDIGSGVATISWAPNTVDTDLVGFIVSRDHYGEVEQLVSEPTLVTTLEDPAPKVGINNYEIMAVDTSGNESAVATISLARPGFHPVADLAR